MKFYEIVVADGHGAERRLRVPSPTDAQAADAAAPLLNSGDSILSIRETPDDGLQRTDGPPHPGRRTRADHARHGGPSRPFVSPEGPTGGAASGEIKLRVGAAGWAIPAGMRDRFPVAGGGLERYGSHLGAVEINSTFYRRHRVSTFERRAAATPAGFRFAVKAPREITHRRKLENCEDLLADLAADLRGLRDRLGPVLIQTPAGLAFDETRLATDPARHPRGEGDS